MLYKYEFIEDIRVPSEHQKRYVERTMEKGVEEIFKKVLQHFPYKACVKDEGVIYSIELAITSAKKTQQAFASIDHVLCFHPDLQDVVRSILDDMHRPDRDNQGLKEIS